MSLIEPCAYCNRVECRCPCGECGQEPDIDGECACDIDGVDETCHVCGRDNDDDGKCSARCEDGPTDDGITTQVYADLAAHRAKCPVCLSGERCSGGEL